MSVESNEPVGHDTGSDKDNPHYSDQPPGYDGYRFFRHSGLPSNLNYTVCNQSDSKQITAWLQTLKAI